MGLHSAEYAKYVKNATHSLCVRIAYIMDFVRSLKDVSSTVASTIREDGRSRSERKRIIVEEGNSQSEDFYI